MSSRNLLGNRYCLTAERKLSKEALQLTFRAGTKVYTGCFKIVTAKNKTNNMRMAIIVAKRNVRQAVDRNKCKRLIRECLRHYQHHLTGTDIVVVVRQRVDVPRSKETQAWMVKCLKTYCNSLTPQ